MIPATSLQERLLRIRERIETAVARRAGPPPRLVGVSKHQPVAAIEAAIAAGLVDFGENYAQELRDKRLALPAPELRWHAIGPVQTNKVKWLVGTHLIHTVDRLALLEAIERRAKAQATTQAVLVQVNVAAEAQKHGVLPTEVAALLDAFAGLEHVRCRGLMMIPPAAPTPSHDAGELARPWFVALARLRDQLARTERTNVELGELSMGMSADFEVAIEEGATIIRVGSAIFGPRSPTPSQPSPHAGSVVS